MSRRLRMTVTVGAPLLAAVIFLLRNRILGLAAYFPPCVFYAATGYYCPGCGNTRSVRAMLHGHLLTAVRNNVTMPFLALLLILLYAETVSYWFRRDGKPLRLLPRNGWFWGIVIGLFFVYFAVRNLIPGIAPV